MPRSTVLSIIVLLALLAAQAAAGAYKPRIVALNGVTGLGLAALLESDAYEVEIGKSADIAVARLTSGAADAAALPVSTAALLRNRGIHVKLAAITNYGSLYIISSGKEGKLAQLAASSIGVPGRGTMLDVTLTMLLAGHDLPSTGIQYYSSPAELANLLAAGRVKTALLPEPWVSQVLFANPSLGIVADIQALWKGSYGFDYPLSCVVVTESFIDERPAELKRLLDDIKDSVAWVEANPAEAAAIAEAKLMIEKEAAKAAIPRCNFKYLAGLKAKDAASAFFGKVFAVSPELIGGKLPDDAFYFSL